MYPKYFNILISVITKILSNLVCQQFNRVDSKNGHVPHVQCTFFKNHVGFDLLRNDFNKYKIF